jgi:hypothetical protein
MSEPDPETAAPDRVRLFESNGRIFVHVADAIPPHRIRDILSRTLGAKLLRRVEDPLGDWVDLHFALGPDEFVLSASYRGTDLYVPSPGSCEILRSIVEQLASALDA